MTIGDLEWLAELDETERERRIKEAFRKVAASEDGFIVFHTLLANLYFYRPADTPDHQTLNDFAKQMLAQYFDVKSDRVTEALLRSQEIE